MTTRNKLMTGYINIFWPMTIMVLILILISSFINPVLTTAIVLIDSVANLMFILYLLWDNEEANNYHGVFLSMAIMKIFSITGILYF